MALHSVLSRCPGFVRLDVAGEAGLDDLRRLVDELAARTLANGDRRVLVDLTRVHESLKFTDHYALGELVARHLGHLERLASVVPASRRTGTSEKVANAGGMLLRVFVDPQEAVAWLERRDP